MIDETDARSASAVVPPPRPSSGWRSFAIGLAGGAVGAALLLAAAGTAGWPLLKARLAAEPEVRLNALEQRLAALEARPAGGDVAPPRPEALETRPQDGNGDRRLSDAAQKTDRNTADIARLTTDIDSLRRAIPPEGTILRLADRAEQAEKVARDIAGRHQSAEALLLVAGQLREAVARGDSFQAELNAARRLAPAEAGGALDILTPWADRGVPRQDRLNEDFARQADDIIRATLLPEGDGLQARLWRKLAALVSLRRVDGEGDDTAAIVARAERGVKDGDLSRAVAELHRLEEAPARRAASWLQAAEARLAADHAVDALATIALTAAGQAEKDSASGG